VKNIIKRKALSLEVPILLITKGKGLRVVQTGIVNDLRALAGHNRTREKGPYRKPRRRGVESGRQTSLLYRD
jgi:hypothetical protein